MNPDQSYTPPEKSNSAQAIDSTNVGWSALPLKRHLGPFPRPVVREAND